jgi:hypothetical protein
MSVLIIIVVSEGGWRVRWNRMCDYCTPNDDDYRWKSLSINLGDFGKHVMDLSVSPSLHRLTVELRPDDIVEPLWIDSIKIRYCPYCGRRLKDGKKV